MILDQQRRKADCSDDRHRQVFQRPGDQGWPMVSAHLQRQRARQERHDHHQHDDQDQERLVRHTPTPQPTNVAMNTLKGELPIRLRTPMQATAANAAISLLRVLHSDTST